MPSDQRFLSRLATLAKLVHFDLDDDVVELYDRLLAPLGYDSLCSALDRIAVSGPTQWPSIKHIREVVTGVREPGLPAAEGLDDARARQAVAEILAAAAKFGAEPPASRHADLRAALSPLAWEVVTGHGGWSYLVECLGSGPHGAVTAQMRELAKAKITLARHPELGEGGSSTAEGLVEQRASSGDLRAVVAVDIRAALPPNLRHLTEGE